MEEVTTYEVTSVTEQFSTTVEVNQQCVDSMLEEIQVNTLQSAECLTSITALCGFFLVFLIGKFIYNIFKGIFS